MANEDELHRCVTKFMLDTSQYTNNEHATELCFIRLSAAIAAGHYVIDYDVVSSGSSAEFYIKPMLSSIGDIDIMISVKRFLTIPYRHRIPMELRDCCKNSVTCVYQMIDSHKPGYIYLQPMCILNKSDIDNNAASFKRNFAVQTSYTCECGPQPFLNHEICNSSFLQSIMTVFAIPHGPARKLRHSEDAYDILPLKEFLFSSIDYVLCIRCPIWPPLAVDWPTRNRDHNWPDQTTINLIVNKACEVVAAVHPSCRQDEWMNTHQWRLSFSRAEVTLLNSWTPVQQIVYHMLRFVLKREVFSKTEDENPCLLKLSTYHVKTLMLWECEQNPPAWWSAETSLVNLCSWLLHKFSDWVADKRCQHYFISNCNLLDDFIDESSPTICNNIRRFSDASVLLSWFFENYVLKCAQCCPENVSKLFEDLCSSNKLQIATHAIIEWKLSTVPRERFNDDCEFEKMMLSFHLMYRPDTLATSIMPITKELQNFDSRLRDYVIAATSLWMAYIISIHSLTEGFLEVLSAFFDAHTDVLSDTATNGLSGLSTVRTNALEMLHNELLKAYLFQTFISQNGQESTSTVVHVLLAALYYKSGQFREAVDHCRHVVNQRDCSDCTLDIIGTKYLLQLDESVDSVFGLIRFYQYVKRTTLIPNLCEQQESKLAFSAQLFAHYLHLKCSSVADAKVHQIKYRYHLFVAKLPLLTDILLFKSLKMQLDECTEMSIASLGNNDTENNASCCMDTSLLVTMTELVALEKLIEFRESIVREVHSEQFPVLNEFELLHAYRCGLYQECLETCRNHVNMLLRAGCPRNQFFFIGTPVFFSLLDGELLSLFGVMRLSYPIVVLFLIQFPDAESISLLTLLLYLVFQCQKKLHSDLLYDTLQTIRYVHDEVYPDNDKRFFVDKLILKLTYRSLKLYIDDSNYAV